MSTSFAAAWKAHSGTLVSEYLDQTSDRYGGATWSADDYVLTGDERDIV